MTRYNIARIDSQGRAITVAHVRAAFKTTALQTPEALAAKKLHGEIIAYDFLMPPRCACR
tara:strand:+ start:292 stop:471 length:180 start_codon:yes stop_codon:yes gene_type:complete